MKTIFDKEYNIFDREKIVDEFMEELPLPQKKIANYEPRVSVDSPLICFYPDGASSSATIG